MKRLTMFALFAALSVAWAVPMHAQRMSNTEYARKSRKAEKKQQKIYRKATKKQQKAMKKYAKAQGKAASKANRRGR